MLGGPPMPTQEPANESNNIDIYLDVDHVWQLDAEHNIAADQRRTICAIACMKILIDFVMSEQAKLISLKTMFTEMKDSGAQNDNMHWKHSDQVDYFKKLGLISWRRNWLAAGSDSAWLRENEGYDNNQITMIEKQTQHEEAEPSGLEDIKNKSLLSFRQSFDSGMPVIASVKPGFSTNKQDHQIVLNGIVKQDGIDYLYFTDPVQDPAARQEKQKVELKRFFDFFNFRAIFVTQPEPV